MDNTGIVEIQLENGRSLVFGRNRRRGDGLYQETIEPSGETMYTRRHGSMIAECDIHHVVLMLRLIADTRLQPADLLRAIDGNDSLHFAEITTDSTGYAARMVGYTGPFN